MDVRGYGLPGNRHAIAARFLHLRVDRLAGFPTVAGNRLIVGLLAAAWLNFVIHSQLLLSDSLFLFFFTGSLLFAAKYLRAARFIDAVLVGLLCGAAIMTRSVALYIPISMAVCGPFISWKLLGKWRPGVFAGIAMFIASLVFASPLIWRNMEQFGTYQLTAQSGSHFLNWIVGYVQSLDKGTTFSEETQEIQKKLREDSPSESWCLQTIQSV